MNKVLSKASQRNRNHESYNIPQLSPEPAYKHDVRKQHHAIHILAIPVHIFTLLLRFLLAVIPQSFRLLHLDPRRWNLRLPQTEEGLE
jgi:hypothetical protein